MNFSIEAGTICSYGKMLAAEERSAGTIEKYLRDVRAFASWLGGRALNKEETAGWKQHLLAQGYTPVTVNSMLSALNRFFTSSAETNAGSGFCGFSAAFSAIPHEIWGGTIMNGCCKLLKPAAISGSNC